MICMDENSFVTGIISTTLLFMICKLVSLVYKTEYYYVPVIIIYFINIYDIDHQNHNPLVVMLNSFSLIWLLCLVDKIANSVFSNIFFTTIFVYTLTMIQ